MDSYTCQTSTPATHSWFKYVLMLLLLMPLCSEMASAQTVHNIDQIESDAMLARLSDTQIRALVAKHLEQSLAAQRPQHKVFNPAISVMQLQHKIGSAQARLAEMLSIRHRIQQEYRDGWVKISGKNKGGSFSQFLIIALLAFGLGWIAEKLAGKKLNPIGIKLASCRDIEGVESAEMPLIQRLVRLATVLGIGVAGIFIFSIVASITYVILASSDLDQRMTFFFYLSALTIVRLASTFIGVFYAPKYSRLRLPLYDDQAARGMHRGLVITIALSAFAFFTCALLATLEVDTDAHPLLLISVGNLYVIALSITVFIHRQAIIHDIRVQANQNSPRYVLASVWPSVIILITISIWLSVLVSALSGGLPLYGAALFTTWVVLLYPTIDAAFEREAIRAANNLEEVLVATMRVVRLVVGIALVILVASVWRVHIFSLGDGGLGSQLTAIILQISFIFLITYIIWQATRIWIDRKIKVEDDAMIADGRDPAEIGGTGLSRTRTLLPLLKGTLYFGLGSIVLMLTLSALGMDIAPVLAGAGVVGLALGFGSQTLVRDVVSGGFFLIDDAFRLGEYVDVGKVKGTVEKIQLRSLRLRHHLGAIHTVPFGEIATLTNYSRDWAIMKLKFRVPFDTDIEKLRKTLKNVGKELGKHPELADDFLQPFKSQGVLDIDDYGLVVRAKFMCKPGAQYLIRRYAYAEIQKAFYENGIEFAKPEIRVSAGENDDMEEKRKAGAAAIAASSIAATTREASLAD